ASTITRLFDMNIKPYLLSSTLLGVMAQRLVRVNCSKCKEPEDVSPEVRQILRIGAHEVFYHGIGCDHCNDTGFTGRTIVYELLEVTSKIAALINQGADTQTIQSAAKDEGMVPLSENALALAREGVTSIKEVLSIGFE
ncbi:MAG: hypothetical protein GQ470_02705, partial [Gammaproteobacteria bacterium]|nr:hypothetical protein [Gammaproteobacteria bacterium]